MLQRLSVAIPRLDGVAAAVLVRSAPHHLGGLGDPSESPWQLTRAEAVAGTEENASTKCDVSFIPSKGMSSKEPGVYRHESLLGLG